MRPVVHHPARAADWGAGPGDADPELHAESSNTEAGGEPAHPTAPRSTYYQLLAYTTAMDRTEGVPRLLPGQWCGIRLRGCGPSCAEALVHLAHRPAQFSGKHRIERSEPR
jgi:hypothetical protein